VTILQIIAASVGLIVIALVLWNIRGHRRHGDGKIPEYDAWNIGGDGHHP